MDPSKKVFVSVVIPCYNEEAILESNLKKVVNFMETKADKYQWELVVVDDGSKDNTGKIADEFARKRTDVRVIHHPVNLNLGWHCKPVFVIQKVISLLCWTVGSELFR
jgi:glycosyltransferase involved in cell wall biosynthesis